MSATLLTVGLSMEIEGRRNQAAAASPGAIASCGAALFGPLSAARSDRYRVIAWLGKRAASMCRTRDS